MPQPEVLYGWAQEAADRREWPRVRELCLQVFDGEGPVPPKFSSLMGTALRALGEHQEAVRYLYDAALRFNTADAHFDAAEGFMGADMLDHSRRHYELALERDPKFTDAHIRLGQIFAQRKQLAAAQKAFERAIQLDPRAVVARFHLAEVCLMSGNQPRALSQLHLVLMLRPGYDQALLLRGKVFFELGDFRQALVEYCSLVNVGFTDPAVFRHMVEAFEAIGDHAQALLAKERAFLLKPEWGDYGLQVAQTREASGQFRKALTLYRKLLRAPDYRQEAREAITRIEARFSLANPDDPTQAPEPSEAPTFDEPLDDTLRFEPPEVLTTGTGPLLEMPAMTAPLGSNTYGQRGPGTQPLKQQPGRAPGTAPLQAPAEGGTPAFLRGVKQLVDQHNLEGKLPQVDLSGLKGVLDRFRPRK